MTCFACEREPTRQCPRCGRPYCDEHGEDVCDACLNPGSGVPSFTLYRGSLLALLIGTAVAVWLIVQPSGGETSANQALRPQLVTPTAVARAVAGTTPAVPPAQTPAAPPATTPLAGTPNLTPGAAPATTPGATPGAPPAGTPRPPGTPAAGTTPASGGTPAPAAGTGSYTVVSGDTLSSICNQVKPASMSVSECVDRVVTLNRLSSASEISIGQQLTVPK
jgi:nucleoid-associated protein YgaU